MSPLTRNLKDYFLANFPSVSSSSNIKQQSILFEVISALESDRLDLPVMPEMALNVKALFDDPDSSTSQFVQLISSDLAVTLYIMKAANIAAFSNGQRVANLHDAILRLGYRMIYSIVLSITLTKLFHAQSTLINHRLQQLWQRCRTVAANSYVLAQKKKHLKPEDAMLAGLIHEIGALPLYLYADRHYPEIDELTLDALIDTFSAPVSLMMLRTWNFPDELIDVVADKVNQRRAPQSSIADYVDVVAMAKSQMSDVSSKNQWVNNFAAERMGYYPGDCENFFASYAGQLTAAKGMLGLSMV